MAATLRSLGIKTRTCRRAMRELRSYEEEVEKEAAKTAAMKERGADPYDLKQQENVLAESRMMIPDCHKRLEATLAELEATLAELKESGEQGVEIGEAESAITEVETVFEQFEDQLTSQERRCVEVLASILIKYLP
ncbi:tubulin-folding cofactor A-like [Aegilops tauschii subsp. strangulata]|nr:tubulin-folding cofactor A-like [Aegilops tauschii subsp. strangulata]XP_044417102.1 tubulin-folding cofactor A-like [Triticum aestivum]